MLIFRCAYVDQARIFAIYSHYLFRVAMQPKEAPEVMECLADGYDPSTGEALSAEGVWQSTKASRAFSLAIDLLRREAARPAWPD